MQGALQVAQQVVAHDGIRGLYRGFGTVILGVIPARGVRCTDACAMGSLPVWRGSLLTAIRLLRRST